MSLLDIGKLKDAGGYTAWDYASSIVTLLHQIKEILSQGQGDDPEHRRIPFAVATDGSGNGLTEIVIPRGERWILKGWAYSNTAATAVLRVFAGSQDGTGLLLNSAAAAVNAGQFWLDEPVSDSDNKLIVQILTGDATANIQGNLKVERFEKQGRKVKATN